MSGLRLVVYYALAIAVVLGVQRIPVLGVIIMFLMAPLWSAVLLNMMLVKLFVFAAIRSIDLRWALVPIACYGAWAAAVVISTVRANAARSAYDAANRQVPQLAKTDRTLVVSGQNAYEVRTLATELTKFSDLDGIYAQGFRLRRAYGDTCRGNFAQDTRRVSFGFYERDRCVIGIAESPPSGPTIGIAIELSASKDMLAPQKLKRLAISRVGAGGSSQIGALTLGSLSYLSPWPLFFSGCALNSGGPSWDCATMPIYRAMWIGSRNDLDYVAEILGIPRG